MWACVCLSAAAEVLCPHIHRQNICCTQRHTNASTEKQHRGEIMEQVMGKGKQKLILMVWAQSSMTFHNNEVYNSWRTNGWKTSQRKDTTFKWAVITDRPLMSQLARLTPSICFNKLSFLCENHLKTRNRFIKRKFMSYYFTCGFFLAQSHSGGTQKPATALSHFH